MSSSGLTRSAEEVLTADLVACSGRRSRTPEWLAELGYTPPDVEELRVDATYATREYRLPSGVLDGERFMVIGPTPDTPRGSAAMRVQGDRSLVTLFGMGVERPATEPEAELAFARRLPIPDLHDAWMTPKH